MSGATYRSGPITTRTVRVYVSDVRVQSPRHMDEFFSHLQTGARLVGNDRQQAGDVIFAALINGTHPLCCRTPYLRERYVHTVNELKRCPELVIGLLKFAFSRREQVVALTQHLWRLRNQLVRCMCSEEEAASVALVLVWFDDTATALQSLRTEGLLPHLFSPKFEHCYNGIVEEVLRKKSGPLCL
jgi:hypothetical protein